MAHFIQIGDWFINEDQIINVVGVIATPGDIDEETNEPAQSWVAITTTELTCQDHDVFATNRVHRYHGEKAEDILLYFKDSDYAKVYKIF